MASQQMAPPSRGTHMSAVAREAAAAALPQHGALYGPRRMLRKPRMYRYQAAHQHTWQAQQLRITQDRCYSGRWRQPPCWYRRDRGGREPMARIGEPLVAGAHTTSQGADRHRALPACRGPHGAIPLSLALVAWGVRPRSLWHRGCAGDPWKSLEAPACASSPGAAASDGQMSRTDPAPVRWRT